MNRASFVSGIAASSLATPRMTEPFARLEARYGGRLGVFAIDTATGAHVEHRANERFPMCSTFKLLLVGAVLARVDAGRERLDRSVRYGTSDLLDHAPVARANVARGALSVRELCAAAIDHSDNTAANLLLRDAGGPARVTAFARTLGDGHTRLDRYEPALNTAIPGDVRDTTTPAAMTTTIRALCVESALSRASRHRLVAWLLACETGAARIRAGVPRGWHVGDKTGTGYNGSTNDVAMLVPPRRQPIFVSAYYTSSPASYDAREAVLADVGRIVASTFMKPARDRG